MCFEFHWQEASGSSTWCEYRQRVVRQCRAVRWHDFFPRDWWAHEWTDGFGFIHDEIKVVLQKPTLSQPRLFFFSLNAGPVASIVSNFICVTSEIVFHPSYSHVIRTDSRPFAHLLHPKKDNEAVIKMIINWRSPTMRHVSRTHSSWLVIWKSNTSELVDEQQPRTVRPVMGASSSDSEWNIDEKWSSQVWKSDELMEVRPGRPVYEQPPGLFTQNTDRFTVDDDDMDSETVAESDMSLLFRSFLLRVNVRLRKILDQSSKDATQDSNKHSFIWWMFMSSTLEASVFMGKNYSENYIPSKLKKISQWNRCSTYLKSW